MEKLWYYVKNYGTMEKIQYYEKNYGTLTYFEKKLWYYGIIMVLQLTIANYR